MDEVVFVEFDDDGRPFAACVRGYGGRIDRYDVDYYKRDDALYAHCSGGADYYLDHWHHRFWAEADIVVTCNSPSKKWQVVAPECQRLESPGDYGGSLWAWAWPGDCIWCSECKDMVLIVEMVASCEHIWYCDECDEWSTPDNRCDCEQTDER